jgi:hypothetical protein
MEFLQNLDFASLLLFSLLCALVLGVVVILFFGVQIIGSILGVFGDFFGLFTGIIGGGPASWCGCLVLLIGCGLCSVIALAIFQLAQTCDTNPVNLCRFLGY